MKNKKVLVLVGSFLLILGLLIIIMLVNAPKEKNLEEVLVANDYKLKNEFKEGTKGEEEFVFPRNTYRYQKGSIYLMVYEYDSLDEIRKEVLATYEQEAQNSFKIDLKDEAKYIYKKTCDEVTCFYDLGYEAELVSTIVDIDLTTEVDKLFDEIIVEKSL